jgi:hypothetical protein
MKWIAYPRALLAALLILLAHLSVGVNDTSAAEWQVTLDVSNGGGDGDTVVFGVHPDATPGIDPALGEVGLPPWPPSSLFEVRFMLPATEGVRLDLRDSTHTERFHTIKWQAGDGGYPVTVRWSILSLPYASLQISDGYGGVFIPPMNMFEVDSLVVPPEMSYITQLTVTVVPGVKPNAGPRIDPIPRATIFVGQQFPEYSLDDYVFDPDTPDESIQWFVTDNQAIVFEIDEDRVLRVRPPQGWEGSETVTFTARDPELHTEQTTATFSVVPGGRPVWTFPFSLRNGASEDRAVDLGIHPDGSDAIDPPLGEVALPPWPPSTAFDARFLLPDGFTWSVLDIRESVPGSIVYHLKWQAGNGGYPVTIQWPSVLPLGDFTIQDDMGGVFIPPTNMVDTTDLVIPPAQSFITGLIVSSEAVVDTTPPLGPEYLLCTGYTLGFSASLEWLECIEEHFAYYEVLYDTAYFDTNSQFVWDWTEDAALMQIGTTSTTVNLPLPVDRYRFRVRAWDTFGNVSPVSEPIVVTGVSQDQPRLPALLLKAWPNPFRDAVAIWYSVPNADRDATLSIYDVAGRLVRRINMPLEDRASGVARWNGRASDGSRVPSGVYFCRLETNRGSASRKIVLVR